MSDQTQARSDEESFSFGLAELRRAANAGSEAARAAARARPVAQPLKVVKPQVSGFDPYNSTGGFERTNAWNRIRKR